MDNPTTIQSPSLSDPDYARPKIGISRCLLGEEVRYDGEAKLDHYLRDTWGQFVEWIPVCPEVECGLPVPRDPIQLTGNPDAPRLEVVRTGRNITDIMQRYSRHKMEELSTIFLHGFILKSRSPSCGLQSAEVAGSTGTDQGRGTGIFARALKKNFPLLAIEEDEALHDPHRRDNFVERMFTLAQYRRTVKGAGGDPLLAFHTRRKLQLMAHDPETLKHMGQIVAERDNDPQRAHTQYERLLSIILDRIPERGRQVNVLQHAAGYFSDTLSRSNRAELSRIIDEYGKGATPLSEPLAVLRYHARTRNCDYLLKQSYLFPTPPQMHLRSDL